jgi:hypothetical protein
MASFEFLAVILTGLGLTASMFYYARVLENANKTRRTQMLMELYAVYRNPEFAAAWGEIMDQEYENFDDYWQKYGFDTNREVWNRWQSVARWFNGIGVLLKKGMVDIDLVEELLGVIIFVSWSQMSPILYGFREWTKGRKHTLYNREKYQSLSGFEYLYTELKKRDSINP